MEDLMRRAGERAQRVPKVLRALQGYFRLTDGEVAAGTGIRAKSVNDRMRGKVQCTPHDLAVFAGFFGVPELALFADPDDAIRYLIDHKGDVMASPAGQMGKAGCLTAASAA